MPQKKIAASKWRWQYVLIPLLVTTIAILPDIIRIIRETITSPPQSVEASSNPAPRITPFPKSEKSIITFTRNFNFYMMEPDGTGETLIQNHPDDFLCPSLSPDHEKILFTSDFERVFQNYDIYTIDHDGNNLRNLTNNLDFREFCAFWSPDQTKILFMRTYSEDSDIFVMNSDGSDQKNLTNVLTLPYQRRISNRISETSWSPDGKKFVFSSNYDGPDFELYIYDFAYGNAYPITENDVDDVNPSWSPDGTKITFMSRTAIGHKYDIMVLPLGIKLPSNGINITNTEIVNESDPSWSPDSSLIIFVSDRDGNNDLYTMDMSGSKITKLTNSPSSEERPHWMP